MIPENMPYRFNDPGEQENPIFLLRLNFLELRRRPDNWAEAEVTEEQLRLILAQIGRDACREFVNSVPGSWS